MNEFGNIEVNQRLNCFAARAVTNCGGGLHEETPLQVPDVTEEQ